jgi:hypothetical protein
MNTNHCLPNIAQSVTSDKNSFAYTSARERWPIILVRTTPIVSARTKLNHQSLTTALQTGAIDDVHKAVSAEKDADKAAEGKTITQSLAALKYEMQHDRVLT